jgi:hypothetical protein
MEDAIDQPGRTALPSVHYHLPIEDHGFGVLMSLRARPRFESAGAGHSRKVPVPAHGRLLNLSGNVGGNIVERFISPA